MSYYGLNKVKHRGIVDELVKKGLIERNGLKFQTGPLHDDPDCSLVSRYRRTAVVCPLKMDEELQEVQGASKED